MGNWIEEWIHGNVSFHASSSRLDGKSYVLYIADLDG